MSAIARSFRRYSQPIALAIILVTALYGLHPSSAWAGPPTYNVRATGFAAAAGAGRAGNYRLTSVLAHCRSNRAGGDEFQVTGNMWTSDPVCLIEFEDFARFAESWRDSNPICDLDHSGRTDLGDMLWFAGNWLTPCPAGWQLK